MSGFAPGDLIVCVYAGPCRLRSAPAAPIIHLIKQGAIYRVQAMHLTHHGEPLVSLVGMSLPAPMLGFDVARFRKIDPATESFTAEMRACRPIKHREPA